MQDVLGEKFPTLFHPQPSVKAENRDTAALLQVCFAGDKGELTSVAQYEYGAMVLAGPEPRLSQIMREAARAEANHLQLIGQLIRLLGADPKYLIYRDGKSEFWRAEHCDYSKLAEKILLEAIQLEKNAVEIYRDLGKRMEDPGASAVLKRIGEEELLHLEYFSNLLRQRCR